MSDLGLDKFEYIKRNTVYKYLDNDNKYIELNTYGLEEIPETTIAILKNKLSNYPALKDATLYLNQDSKSEGFDELKYIEQLRIRDSIELINKNVLINVLEKQAIELSRLKKQFIPFKEIAEEVKINYEDIETLSYYSKVTTNFSKTDTIPVIIVTWNENAKRRDIKDEMEKLEKWLRYKLPIEKLVIENIR